MVEKKDIIDAIKHWGHKYVPGIALQELVQTIEDIYNVQNKEGK